MKHLMVSEEGRYNQQEQMFGAIPAQTEKNEEMFNNSTQTFLISLPYSGSYETPSPSNK